MEAWPDHPEIKIEDKTSILKISLQKLPIREPMMVQKLFFFKTLNIMARNRLIQDLRQNLIHHLGRPASLEAIKMRGEFETNLKKCFLKRFIVTWYCL